MDLQSRIEHTRHPFGSTMRIFDSSEGVPHLEPEAQEPPSQQEVFACLFRVGCISVAQPKQGVIHARHSEGYTIKAHRSPGGWLLTGGPMDLLNYGVPSKDALERFPDTLASVQAHAESVRSRAGER
jgi:hypothetical protein